MEIEDSRKNPSYNIESAETLVHPELIDVVSSATFAPNRAIDDSVRGIRLGAFELEAQDLLTLARAENHATEKGRYVYVLPNGRVLIKRDDVKNASQMEMIGEVDVNTAILPHMLPKRERQNRFLATLMHTHPYDIAPSTTDLHHLFINDFSPRAMTFMFVITPEQYYIVFRGKNSPQLSVDEAVSREAKYYGAVKRRIQRNLSIESSWPVQLDVNRRANYAMLRDIAKQYDLRVFRCPISESIAMLDQFQRNTGKN